MSLRRVLAIVAVVLTVLVTAVAVGAFEGEPVVFTASSPALDDRVAVELFAAADLEPIVVTDSLATADSLLEVMVMLYGSVTDDGWEIDLSGTPDDADLVAWALMQRSITFERVGETWDVLTGSGSLPTVSPETPAVQTLVHIVERHGTVTGSIFEGMDGQAEVVASIARAAGFEPAIDVQGGRSTVTLPSAADRIAIARLPYRCVDRVPVVGGRGCRSSTPERLASVSSALDETAWRVGVTGSLIPGAPLDRSAEDGGVNWTNREAQRYVADAVGFGDDEITITTRSRSNPSVDELPFESGLIVSDGTFGLGRLEVNVAVPAGNGLWPAIWLLDAKACDAPGRCPGYASPAYHEIDILETRGQEPDVAYASLHWWDDQLRSASSSSDIPGLSDGSVRRLTIERRPGLLRWLIDGEEIAVIAGPVNADAGPHRTRPMRLILNVAVGGVFAGDLNIGRNGSWWGDARVPAGFPDLGWDVVEMRIADVRYEPFGRPAS